MGINQLITYIKRNKNYTLENVSLKELSEIHRKKFNVRPVLAIYGLPFCFIIDSNAPHWIYGGQWRYFIREITSFIHKLTDLGIEPVFFFNGVVTEDVKNMWAANKKITSDKIFSVFQSMRNDVTLDKKLFYSLPPGMLSSIRYIIKYECNCKVYSSINDTDRTVVKFARENLECFAILNNYPDIIIFDTKPVLSAYFLNTKTMETKMFLRSGLAKSLQISTSQLPLLSYLAGNKLIPTKMLEEFHRKISPGYGYKDIYLIDRLARFMKRNCITETEENIIKLAEELNIDPDLLKRGLDWYDIDIQLENEDGSAPSSSEILNFLRDKCVNCEISTLIYTLLRQRKYTEGKSLEDPTEEALLPSTVIYRPMRQRMYRVLFEGKPISVEEIYEWNGRQLEECVEAVELNFEDEIPSLHTLWIANQNNRQLRFQLFMSCLQLTITPEQLEHIEEKYVPLCCILNYLLNSEGVFLQKWEVEVFIGQAVHPRADDVDYISNLRVLQEDIDRRAVHLVAIFQRGFHNWMYTHAVCGYPFSVKETMIWKYFDGKLFHYLYNLRKNYGTLKNTHYNLEDTEIFRKLTNITTTGKDLDQH